ncbi:hypothetical protein ANACAC_00142 [Anaerostipes caccae L1-92]|uniref:Uncharacterized protein n=1 Tax=Anaerostipes caccae (strain DSM 14662 / CCUG 47493 / JCM 13470 / NCIMB 13811 / L1-92) TaxID=411490 RepID=B0M9H4_ANACD|nr:hypothetical protein ANACAC_00142 [Anaerostipes caccae L1-92]
MKTDFGTFLKNQPAGGKFPRLIFFFILLYTLHRNMKLKRKRVKDEREKV